MAPNVTSEHDLAVAVLVVARGAPNSVATFKRCYTEIPNLINLKSGDLAPSGPRKGEAMWRQRVRNIKSHYLSDENFINLGYLVSVPRVGYKITDDGKKYLQTKGY